MQKKKKRKKIPLNLSNRPYFKKQQNWKRSREELLESSSAEKDLGVLVDEKHELRVCTCSLESQQDPRLNQKKGAGNQGIIPLYLAFKRPHLKFCVYIWGPQHRRDVELLERVQRRTMKTTKELSSPLKTG